MLLEIQASLLVLIIVVSLLAVFFAILLIFPNYRKILFPNKNQSSEESAMDAVKEIIQEETKDSQLENEIKHEKYSNYLLKQEKELKIVFSEDDIEPLILQLIQDEKDNYR